MILHVRRKTKTMDLWVAKYWHKLFSNKEQEASEDSIHGQYEPILDTEDVANAAGEGTASDFQEKGDDYSDGSGPSGDFLVGVSFGRGGRSRQLRNRPLRGYFVKPAYYVYNSVQSQTALGLRPLLVTDGSLIITSASNSFNDNVQIESEPKQNIEKARSTTREVPSGGGGAFHSQGSHNGMLLFFLGFTFGMIFTTVANKRGVDNLNDLLNQTKNLVQDLHEELEMKDLYIVKEVGNEDFESRGTNEIPFLNHTPIASSTEPELDKSIKYDEKGPDYHKAEDSEAISKIEAELEAELERLELNMKTSSLERISDYVELDPDIVVDIVQGDLRPVKVQKPPGGLADSDCDVTGTSTNHTHTANYIVSPRELSICLHEVIHLQLEARIMELENALENTQKRLHSMESENMIPQNKFGNDMDRPFINLSGEAQNAVNEAYKRITGMSIKGEDALQDTIYNSDCTEKELIHFGKKLFGKGMVNGSISQYDIVSETGSSNLNDDEVRTKEEKASRSCESNETGESEDDDEMGKVLIKRIVDKTRQGSTVVINAQRMMYLMDDQ